MTELFWNLSAQGKEFLYGDKIIPLGHEGVHRLEGGLHRGIVDIVHEDNGPVLRLVQADPEDTGRIFVLPVLGVHRPADDGGVHPLLQVVVHEAVGGPDHEVRGAHDGGQGLPAGVQLSVNFLLAAPFQLDVVPGVEADLVALGGHTLHGVPLVLHLAADEEKGGFDPPLRQAVQELFRGVGPGPVVKGQGHIAPIFPGGDRLGLLPGGEEKGGQGQQERDPPQGPQDVLFSCCHGGFSFFP